MGAEGRGPCGTVEVMSPTDDVRLRIVADELLRVGIHEPDRWLLELLDRSFEVREVRERAGGGESRPTLSAERVR